MKTLQDYKKEIAAATTKAELRRISYEAFRDDTAPINLDFTKCKTLADKVDRLCVKREIELGLVQI